MCRYVLGLGMIVAMLWAVRVDAAVEAELSTDYITLGKSVELTIKVQGKFQTDSLKMAAVDGLRVSSSNTTSRSYSYFRNRSQNKFQVTQKLVLTITAERVGVFSIPPIELLVDGVLERTQAFTLTVAKPLTPKELRASGKLPLVFAERELKPTSVYFTQPVMDTIKLYLKHRWHDLRRFGTENPLFKVFDGMEASKSQEYVNSHPYWVVTVRRILVPLKSGKLELGEYGFQAEVTASPSAAPSQNFFGFGLPGGVSEERVVLPKTHQVVKPLPKENQPQSFQGFVGDVDLSANLSSEEVMVQDPLTLNLVFEGEGWLSSLRINDPKLPGAFQVYADKPVVEEEVSPSGLRGRKVFSYALVPLRVGKHDLGLFEWSYFDTQTQTYRTIATQLGRVEVKDNPNVATATASSTLSSDGDDENLALKVPKVRNADIVDLKREWENASWWQAWKSSVFPQVLILLLLWGAIGCVWIVRLIRKPKRAISHSERLDLLKKKMMLAIKEQDEKAVFAALAWYVSMGDSSAVTAYDIAAKLEEFEISKEDRAMLKELCATIENQRFQQQQYHRQQYHGQYWDKLRYVMTNMHHEETS